MPKFQLSLQFPDPSHRSLLPRHHVARWVRAALESPMVVTIRVVGEDEGLTLNHQYRAKTYATNVLTFAYEPGEADIVLCAPVIEREAKEQGVPLAAHYAHLIVHGVLHAQGYDHEDDGPEAAAMEARETAVLAALGFPDPYANPRG